jgi:hypothetical protein
MSTKLTLKVLESLDNEFEAAFGSDPKGIALEQARVLYSEADVMRKAARDLDQRLEAARLDLDVEVKTEKKLLGKISAINQKKADMRATLIERHQAELEADKLNKADGSGFIKKIKWINEKVAMIFKDDLTQIDAQYEQVIAALDDTHTKLSAETHQINEWMKAAWNKDQEAAALLKEVGISATRKEVVK